MKCRNCNYVVHHSCHTVRFSLSASYYVSWNPLFFPGESRMSTEVICGGFSCIPNKFCGSFGWNVCFHYNRIFPLLCLNTADWCCQLPGYHFSCFIKFNYRLPQILWSFFCFPCGSESNISAALGVCQEPRNSLTFYTHKLITRKQITDWLPLLLKLSWYINIDHGHFGSFCCHYDLKRVCLIINGFSQPLIMIEIKVLYYQSYSLENGPKMTNSATVCKLTRQLFINKSQSPLSFLLINKFRLSVTVFCYMKRFWCQL